MINLHLGCGLNYFEGWINIEHPIAKKSKVGKFDMFLDITTAFPFENDSVDYVYSEAVMEHFTFEEATNILGELHRILKPQGVIRTAMPDMDVLVRQYMDGSWEQQVAIIQYKALGKPVPLNKCMMMNWAMSAWGHKYLYNFEEFERLSQLTHFESKKVVWGVSSTPVLNGREKQPDCELVIESIKI